MRILFAYRSKPGPAYIPGTTPEQAVKLLPTTHMSAANGLLLPHYLQPLGHEVSVLTDREPEPWWFPQVHIRDVRERQWDCLYLFKLHSVRQWVETYNLLSYNWRRVAAWFDFGGIRKYMKWCDMIDSFAWGTDRIRRDEEPTLPFAHHCVVELAHEAKESRRRAIQEWAFGNHTWRHRAQQIHEEQLCNL
tara:strand:- start:813 stop:1385 length:573 start_codon:yes stop_codon:yes gene_type:complete